MTTMKMILIAATGAAVTFALFWLGIHVGGKPPGAMGRSQLILLLPAEFIADIFGTRASFLIAGFLEFFFVYILGLLSWRCIRAGKRAK